MRPHPGFTGFLLAAASLVLSAGPLHATSAIPLSVEDLVANSSTIVHGTVVSTRSHWNEDRSLIVTDVTLRVTSLLRGPAAREVVITQPGGSVGKLGVEIPGASAFRPGEETILFARIDGQGNLHPTGLDQGRFPVTTDARTGRKVVRGLAAFEGRADGQVTIKGSPAAPGATPELAAPGGELEDFLGQIRELVRRNDAKGGR